MFISGKILSPLIRPCCCQAGFLALRVIPGHLKVRKIESSKKVESTKKNNIMMLMLLRTLNILHQVEKKQERINRIQQLLAEIWPFFSDFCKISFFMTLK